MEWIQWSYLRVCLLQLYAYEYKCVTDLGPISLTGLLAPFAVHVHCHMIAYVSNVTVIDNVCCIQKDLRHRLLYYCWRPPRRSDDIRNMFFFISCDIEYSFSVTHVYLLFGVIYAMTCMYIYGNKAFWNLNFFFFLKFDNYLVTCQGNINRCGANWHYFFKIHLRRFRIEWESRTNF